MARATCRCGTTMTVPADSPDRVVCTNCGAKIRVRRTDPRGLADGYIRFVCPCGRRLKVKAEGSPTAGKCPDCGRIVPIPASDDVPPLSASHPDAPTEELSADDVAMLEQWSLSRLERQAQAVAPAPMPAPAPAAGSPSPPASSPAKAEAGLRFCPRCGRPVHLGAVACRECGAHVPKR
jgi:hypothetical protein